MRRIFLSAVLIAASGCAESPEPASCPAPAAAKDSSLTMTVYVEGNGIVSVYGWQTTTTELPAIIKQFHPRSAIVTHVQNSSVNYTDAVAARDAIIADGVSDVTIVQVPQ